MEDFALFDLRRMFLGDLPWTFTLEIAFRTAVMLIFTYSLVRLVGGRAVRQLSLVEFLLVIGLGSAVGDPMFYPDVPLAHGMVVVTVAVGLHRGLAQVIARSDRFEEFVEGVPSRVVVDGIIDHEGMTDAGLANDELFQQLRLRDITQLGEVRVAYSEADGGLSVFRFDPPDVRPGLPIEPPLANIPIPDKNEQRSAGLYACRNCARCRELPAGSEEIVCECESSIWTPAALPREGAPRERPDH